MQKSCLYNTLKFLEVNFKKSGQFFFNGQKTGNKEDTQITSEQMKGAHHPYSSVKNKLKPQRDLTAHSSE